MVNFTDETWTFICFFYHSLTQNIFWYLHLHLTHWGRATHICVGKLTIIGSDNALSPGRRQAIICTNAGILLIGPSGTNFGEILIEIYTFSFKKMRLKGSSAKWRPFCLGLNVLRKARSFLYHIVNNTAADDLATGARALAVMVLTLLFQNTLASEHEGLR